MSSQQSPDAHNMPKWQRLQNRVFPSKIIIWFANFLLLSFVVSCSENSVVEPAIDIWEREYSEYYFKVDELSNGDFMLYGGNIARVNQKGIILWSIQESTIQQFTRSIEEIDGNSVLALGTDYFIKEGNRVASATFFDGSGNVVWQTKPLGNVPSVCLTSKVNGDDFLLACTKFEDHTETNILSIELVRLKNDGEIISKESVEIPDIIDNNYIDRVIFNKNNELVYILGNLAIINTNIDGQITWISEFDDSVNWNIHDIIETDEGYAMTGFSIESSNRGQIWVGRLMITDSQGQMLHYKQYDAGGKQSYLNAVSVGSDGGYIMVGTSGNDEGMSNSIMYKVDDEGNTEWKIISNINGLNYSGNDITLTKDQYYAVLGQQKSSILQKIKSN